MNGYIISKSVTKKRVVVLYKPLGGAVVALTAGFANARHFDEDVCNKIILNKIEQIDKGCTYEGM